MPFGASHSSARRTCLMSCPCVKGGFITMRWKQFDRIVMNPPFTQGQDIKHVRRALEWLAPNGILVSVMFGNQERRPFAKLVSELHPQITEVPRGAFKTSGTDIPTVIVRIQR